MNIEHLFTDLFFIFGKFFAILGFFFIAKFYVSSNFGKNVSASAWVRVISYIVAVVIPFILGFIADHTFGERLFVVFIALAIPACVGLYIGYSNLDNSEHEELIKKVYDKMDKQ